MEWQLTEDAPARFGAFIPSALLCDAAAVGLSPSEAMMVDPQQRILLELAHEVRAAWPAQGLAELKAVYDAASAK